MTPTAVSALEPAKDPDAEADITVSRRVPHAIENSCVLAKPKLSSKSAAIHLARAATETKGQALEQLSP